ncbi:hypothetical protein AB0M38_29880 [Streptomyces sp. NPDC051742]|uniref:hypothetical protein n=1 Tax=unclassified Streptomyces TaxID=2593676 RepID=UPI00341BDB3C
MNRPDRGSSKSGPKLDDERKKEAEGLVRSGRPTRVEEWHDPEPMVDEPAPETEPGSAPGRKSGRKRKAG